MNTNKPTHDEELREKLKPIVGIAMFKFKYWDYIEAPQGTLGGKYPNERAIADLNNVLDKTMQLITSRDKSIREEAELNAYLKGVKDGRITELQIVLKSDGNSFVGNGENQIKADARNRLAALHSTNNITPRGDE